MRGIPEYNFPAFREATAVLRSLGYEVFSPHEHDENQGFQSKNMTGEEDVLAYVRQALAVDLAYVAKEADMVVVLPGSQASLGAAAEIAAAGAVHIPVITYEEITEVLHVA